MEKKELRKRIRSSLQEISDAEYLSWSSKIKEKLLAEPLIQKSHTIAITIPRRPEVDTIMIIEELWKLEKRVVVPKCEPKDRSMDFYAFTDFDQLESVYMDLKEPIPTKTTYVNPKEIDVMIVPGIVYDLKGYRIGYGGGYYDRYLENYDGEKISLAFDLQVVQQVPKKSYDIPVNLIITENQRIDCFNNRKETAD